MNEDINYAEKNWIQHGENASRHDYAHVMWNGETANKLLNSPDFDFLPFAYSVWEVTNDTYDSRTDAQKYVSILRANQSHLSGALKYMKNENRVIVYNMHPREKVVDNIS